MVMLCIHFPSDFLFLDVSSNPGILNSSLAVVGLKYGAAKPYS